MRDALEELSAHYDSERVVERGKVITAAGVPSRTDMALRLGHVGGCRIAERVGQVGSTQ